MPSHLTHLNFCSWIRYKHLVLIETLAQTRNMHTAAACMNLTQPALSKMLRDIEDKFGFALFERLPRSMPPTELGEYVVRYAKSVISDSHHFIEHVNRLERGGYGLLRIGAIFAATSRILPETISSIKKQRPLLSISVIEQTSDHLLEMLDQGKLDIMIGRIPERRSNGLFMYQSLEPEPYSLVVRSEHPLCEKVSLTADELVRWPWVLYPTGTPIRDQLEQAFTYAGLSTPVDSVETLSMQMFLHLLQSSPMVAMLPRSMVASQVESGRLVELANPLSVHPLEYGVVIRRDESLSASTRLFLEILLENMALVALSPSKRSP